MKTKRNPNRISLAEHSSVSEALDERRGRNAGHSRREADESQPRIASLGGILSVDQLASLFQCSTAKINRRSRSGELPAFKFGKSWFVRERDLETYIQRKLKSELD